MTMQALPHKDSPDDTFRSSQNRSKFGKSNNRKVTATNNSSKKQSVPEIATAGDINVSINVKEHNLK